MKKPGAGPEGTGGTGRGGSSKGGNGGSGGDGGPSDADDIRWEATDVVRVRLPRPVIPPVA